MNEHVVVAGGGIGGLACALALARAGVSVDVLEQTSAFGEVGAGLQLGPNAVRVLHAWGLTDELQACAAFPELLWVRDAHSGQRLGQLRLGAMALARYAQPYATLHRADLHALLAPLSEPVNNPLGIPGEDALRWGGTGKRRPRPLQPPEV